MNKRHFLVAAASASLLPATAATPAKSASAGPVILTIGGAVTRSNRGAIDPAFDQMLSKHGVKFDKAFTFDAVQLQRLPTITIKPTLEYDGKAHTLQGPLLTTVLASAGIQANAPLRIGLRAVDGYIVYINLSDIQSYRMILATHMDGHPLALGSLGPQWAVYDADRLPAFQGKPLKERFALCPWGVYYIDAVAA